MTIPSIDILARTAATLIDEAPSSDYTNAANKAMWHISRGLDVVETYGGFLIPSGTRGGVVYRVTAERCSCEAAMGGKACWHHACVVIIEQARQAAPTKTIAREQRQTYEAAIAAMDELFAS